MAPVRNATSKEALARLIYDPAMDVITSSGALISNKHASYFDIGLKQASVLIGLRSRIRLYDSHSAVIKKLRDEGWTPDVVESYNYFTKKRKDFFGIADIVAYDSEGELLAIQCTSYSNISARVRKIEDSEHLGDYGMLVCE